MFRKLSTLVLFLLLGSPIVAFAQNTGKLAGRVTDAADGAGLPGANVIIEGTTLGAATDLDGYYVIVGVPVGAWDITARFVGYVDARETGVEINAGYTRTTNFDLQDDSVLMDEIVIEEYRRPLIQNDAIGVPKVLTGAEISQLPVRGVTNVAAIQGGVVSNDGSSDLNIRGGREQEVSYYIDGVKVSGTPNVPQQAISQQEILIGTIPPRYGDAQSGIISITTKSGGRDFFGSVEFITSEVLDDFGYNLGALTIGGPILPNGGASFFLSGSYTQQADGSPYSIPTLRLTDAAYADFQANPQVILLTDGAGGETFVPLPGNIPDGTLISEVVGDPADFGLVVPEGWEIATGSTGNPILDFRTNFNSDLGLFQEANGKDNPSREFNFNGNLQFAPLRNLNVRVGGAYIDERRETFSYTRSWYDRDSNSIDEDRTARGFLTLRQNISNTSFYQLQAEYTKRDGVFYPERFSSNIEDILFYGDIDHAANAVGATYLNFGTNDDDAGIFTQRFQDGGITPGRAADWTFTNPGTRNGVYSMYDITQLRFSGSATTQYGVHQIEFGGEYEQQTRRSWATGSTFSTNIAEFVLDCTPNATNDGCVPGTGTVERGFDSAITSWDEVDFEAAGFLGLIRPSYFGYNYLGTREASTTSVSGFIDAGNRVTDIAPYQPIYYGGYLRDKIEFQDLVIDLGVRLDVFDNNTLVLRDRFALRDIYRASDFGGGSQITEGGELVASLNGALPGTVDGDFAIYVGDENEVVGYRDLQGRFYDATGQEVLSSVVTRDAGGQAVGRTVDGVLNDRVLEDYEPQLTVMPRIGVTFPVTDRALFFASYNVTSQRPSERAFATIQDYLVATSGQTRLNNANLLPEVTTQYELGFRQRLGERAAATISGFFRTQDNKVTLRNINSFPADYSTFLSEDFTTTKGAEFEFELRRTNNVAVRANYTLSFASGTGSDANTASILAWRSQSGIFPETLSPLDFDQRHTINATIDYRLAEGEGPELFGGRPLAGFGLNLLGSFGSGVPYTPLNAAATDPIGQSTNGQVEGEVNSVYNGWTGRLDFKVDRSFNLGPANLKAYVWVQNLLDTDNIYGVYRTTGLPDDDGFLSAPQGIAALDATTNLDERAAYEFAYSNYVGGPVIQNSFKVGGSQIYGLPRRIRFGILMDF